jgi:hypothetical protein
MLDGHDGELFRSGEMRHPETGPHDDIPVDDPGVLVDPFGQTEIVVTSRVLVDVYAGGVELVLGVGSNEHLRGERWAGRSETRGCEMSSRARAR